MRGEEAGHFHEVVGNGLSIVAVGCLHSVVDTLAVDSYMLTQPARSCAFLFDETML